MDTRSFALLVGQKFPISFWGREKSIKIRNAIVNIIGAYSLRDPDELYKKLERLIPAKKEDIKKTEDKEAKKKKEEELKLLEKVEHFMPAVKKIYEDAEEENKPKERLEEAA